MITLALSLLTVVRVLSLTNSNNPMKIRFSILLGSSIIFLLIKIKTGSVWIPLIFFILFTGGILMAFIILASILPNEKIMKLKTSKIFFLILIMTTLITYTKMLGVENIAPQIKSFISTSLTLFLIVSIILIYFFGSVNLNARREYSIRSVNC